MVVLLVNNYNDIEQIKKNIKDSHENFICLSCFDTRERHIKRRDILRAPKRTWLYRECDKCCYNERGICTACPTGDVLFGRDFEYIPVTHLCKIGRRNEKNENISMSELVCPLCNKIIHRVIGKNIIISIVGSRDSGKSHYIGVLLHELMFNMGQKMGWAVVPEESTLKLDDAVFSRLYSTRQILNLTDKNHDGYYEPYVFYVIDNNGKTFTITFFDTAGEDFESDDLMENSAKHTFNASGIIFLIDPLKITNVNSRLDERTIRNSSSVSINKTFKIDAILSIMSTSLRRHHKIKEKKRIPIPLAVLVPKIDVIAGDFPEHYALRFSSNHLKRQGFIDAENRRVNTEMRKWLQNQNDGLLNSFLAQLDMNYENFSFFGASALGWNNSPDENGVFLTPKPHRVEDPFLWILKENKMIKEIKKEV